MYICRAGVVVITEELCSSNKWRVNFNQESVTIAAANILQHAYIEMTVYPTEVVSVTLKVLTASSIKMRAFWDTAPCSIFE
jgi:hypothetical protein